MLATYRRLSQLSTVHKGTAFERRSLQLLHDHFSMLLRCVGGKSDGGIDLVGWWWLPMSVADAAPPSRTDSLSRRRLRVLAQCKAEKKKFGPNYVREMEGVWHAHVHPPTRVSYSHSPSQSRNPPMGAHVSLSEQRHDEHHPCIALLISESLFTQSTLRRALSSNVPFLLLYFPPGSSSITPSSSTSDSVIISPAIGAVYPNPALMHLISPLEIRWERPSDLGGAPPEMVFEGSGRPGLWLHGQRISSWTTDQNGDAYMA